MDEPLSNLDAKMRVSTRAELQKLHRRLGVTTIYVTHDQVEAMTMGDRIAVMKDGLLQQLDTPQALYERPTNMFVAGFIGSPAMNMFTAEAESGEDGLFLKGEGFRIRMPAHIVGRISEYRGKQVVMGVRPEAVHDARFKRQDDPSTEVAASVDVVEPMGRDVYMYLTAGTTPFVARLDDRTDAAPGERIKVAFDTERLHLFDPTSQRSLL
jgi:multiple sugar transport system ATP-binding protein